MLNLDTHILIFALQGSLSPRERGIIEGEEWSISSIVLWEITKLAQSGKIEVDLNDSLVDRVLSEIKIWPLTLPICKIIPTLDFSGDPADEIIAATSIVHQVPLVTRDRAIRDSKIVPLAD